MITTKLYSIVAKDNISIRLASKKINNNHKGLLMVVDKKFNLLGVISDADIRRAIVSGISPESSIVNIYNKNPIKIRSPLDQSNIFKVIPTSMFNQKSPSYIPLVDKNNKVKSLISLENIFTKKKQKINNFKKKKTILLIGGAGYIGSILTELLINEGYNIRIFDNFMYGKESLKKFVSNKNVEIIKGDTRHIEDLSVAFKDISTVIHLAELVGDPLCNLNPEKTYEINYLATNLIITLCKKFFVDKFIYISSCSVYGKNEDEKLLAENSKINPLSIYAKLKLNIEEAIIENTDPAFNYTILRLGTVYGKSYRPRFDLVINLFCGLSATNKPISINSGNQWRPFVHVKDVARSILFVLKNNNKTNKEIFNVISENSKIIELSNTIKKHNKNIKIKINNNITDKRDYKVSAKKINKVLKFKPLFNIDYGINELIKFVKKNKINIANNKYHNYHSKN
jgi:nucleoside-diphosphate-sugar epimerase/CBS domain-containing protein